MTNQQSNEDVNDHLQSEFKEMMDRIERGDALALKRKREIDYLERLIARATDREVSDQLQQQLDELTGQEPSPEEVDAEYALRPYEHTTSFEQDDDTATWHIEYADPYSDAWNADIVNEHMTRWVQELCEELAQVIDFNSNERTEVDPKWGRFGGTDTGDGTSWLGKFRGGIIVSVQNIESEGYLDIQVSRSDRLHVWFQSAILRIAEVLTNYKLNVETTTDEQNNE